ncbi:mechanosensitive ion channel family protein [bacterium]|nr:mechanosensitive ion channel family protein [bacterium]
MFNVKSAFKLLTEKLMVWYEVVIKSIPNIIVAIIVLVIFLLLAKAIKKTSVRILPRLSQNKSINDLITGLASFAVVLVGIFTSLEILGLEKAVTSILAGAGVIGLALGFAFQEIASNFFAGILIAIKEPYQMGDIVEIDNFVGEVTRIELRTTSITTFQGLEIFIPNKDMFTKPIINYTSTPKRRVDIEVGVSYGDELPTVEKLTKEALESLEGRIKNAEVEVYFNEFSSSSINLSARVWVHYTSNSAFLKARHQAIMKIKEKYDEHNITIPFPIRTLDFGIKGGKEIGDSLKPSLEETL